MITRNAYSTALITNRALIRNPARRTLTPLYLKNQDFVSTSWQRIGVLAFAGMLALAVLFALPVLAARPRWRDLTTSLLAGVAATCFLHNLLPLGTDQLLDGSELVFSFEPLPYAASVLGTLASLLLFLGSYRRLRSPLHLASALLAALFFVLPLAQLWGRPGAQRRARHGDLALLQLLPGRVGARGGGLLRNE